MSACLKDVITLNKDHCRLFFNFVIMGFNGNPPRKTALFIYFYITLSTLYGNCHEMDRL